MEDVVSSSLLFKAKVLPRSHKLEQGQLTLCFFPAASKSCAIMSTHIVACLLLYRHRQVRPVGLVVLGSLGVCQPALG